MKTVQCPHCKASNPAPFSITNASNVFIEGFSTDCNACGKEFQPIPDGVYEFDEYGDAFSQGLLTMLRKARISREALVELKQLAEVASTDGMPREAFTAIANDIAPGIGNKLNSYLGKNQYTMTFLQTLMAILATLIAGYALFKPESPPQTVVNNYNYYGSEARPKTEQMHKPRPGKLGSNITLPKKPRKKRGKRT